MKILIIGGTGLISTGIVKHLLNAGHRPTLFNRGQRENRNQFDLPTLVGDRNDFAAFEATMASQRFDVVIDMVCFNAQQADSVVRAFGGRCAQLIFCSTVCTYGVKVPPAVLVDETMPQEPISDYGRNKVACEQIFLRAHESGAFKTTIIRPSSTYGPGGNLIDNLEFYPTAWDRIERGLPILCAGDGLGLWVSTHRDDCGQAFALACGNARTFGQAYNATRDRVFTWRDLYREAAGSLGRRPTVLFMPAGWIIGHDPVRFGLLREITQFHGAYTSAKAKRDLPGWQCQIDYPDGAAATLVDLRQRGKWRDSHTDDLYNRMVAAALAAGVQPVEL